MFFAESLSETHTFYPPCFTAKASPPRLPKCRPASTHSTSAPSSLFLLLVFLPLRLFLSSCLSACPSLSHLSLPPTESSDSDLELSTVRHQPEGLDQLQLQTKFTRKELQSLYRGFKNVRPAAETVFVALAPLLCFI